MNCYSQLLPGEGKFHFVSFAFPGKSFLSSPCNKQHIIVEDSELGILGITLCRCKKNVQNNDQCEAFAVRFNMYFLI